MAMQIEIFILTICLGTMTDANPVHQPTVETNYGLVQGIMEFSRSGREYYAFRGIPYAKPPTNERRFKPPEEPETWDNTRITQKDAPHCMQKNYLFANPTVEGSEDCLYLNIYSPKIRPKKNLPVASDTLPVMVFIHWGGFFAGYSSSDYLGPDYIMDKDVVLVTFNYRLGVLGFLSTNDDNAPGNYGLKDQVAALKFIHNNIHHFGGDNSTVTIFGQSSGGASVNFHMFNKESTKYFHRAISESGSALSLWAQPQDVLQPVIAKAQAQFVGCTDLQNLTAMVDCLRWPDGKTLVDSSDKFKTFSVDPLNVFMPSIEKKTENNPNPFLTKRADAYIRDGDFADIPWIVGVVGNEGNIRAEPILRQSTLRTKLNLNFDSLMPSLLALTMSTTSDQTASLWQKIRKTYFLGKSGVDKEDEAALRGLINVYTDRSFVYSSYQAVKFHHLKGLSNIWFYHFNYTGEHSYGNIFAATDENIHNFDWGVSHCDELLYLFKSPALFQSQLKTHNDKIMIDNMVELWTNFAIYGNPTPEGSKIAKWLKIDDSSDTSDPKKIHYFNIEGSSKNEYPPSLEMKYGFYKNRLKFWEDTPLFENIPELNETTVVIPKQ